MQTWAVSHFSRLCAEFSASICDLLPYHLNFFVHYSKVNTLKGSMPPGKDPVAFVHGFHVLPVTFPALPSLPSSATHYLYVAAHEPQVPSESTPRSLFVVNVPIDCTDAHLRHLLSLQLGLPHGRIEDVSFEKERRTWGAGNGEAERHREPKGKKRKRGVYQRPAQILEESRLPSTWDRDLQVNGGSAIVTFVDKSSMDAALKATAKAIKIRKEIIWGEGLELDHPNLGSASKRGRLSPQPSPCTERFNRIPRSSEDAVSR